MPSIPLWVLKIPFFKKLKKLNKLIHTGATLKIFEIFLVRRVWVSLCAPNHRDLQSLISNAFAHASCFKGVTPLLQISSIHHKH